MPATQPAQAEYDLGRLLCSDTCPIEVQVFRQLKVIDIIMLPNCSRATNLKKGDWNRPGAVFVHKGRSE